MTILEGTGDKIMGDRLLTPDGRRICVPILATAPVPFGEGRYAEEEIEL